MAMTHPGKIFKEQVVDQLPRMTISKAAAALGVSRQHLSKFCNGQAACTAEMAYRIGLATDTSPIRWLEKQTKYDLEQIMLKGDAVTGADVGALKL